MVKITHPSMRKGRDTAAQNSTQTYIVEDATGDELETLTDSQAQLPIADSKEEFDELDEFEDKLRQFETSPTRHEDAGQAPFSGAKEVKTLPKKTLEDLLFAGRIEQEFELAGNKYMVTTLTNKEHNSVVRELYGFGEAADLFIIKSLTLALALRSINGIDLGDITVDEHFDNDLYRRKEIIDNLQMTVVEKLYENYSVMVQASTKMVQGEDLKNS